MGKYQLSLSGRDINTVMSIVHSELLQGSLTCELNSASNFTGKNVRCCVRVYERYSIFGQNRVSLTLTYFQEDGGPVEVSAISAGGSQALFAKINNVSEEAFLNEFRKIIHKL